MQPFKVGDKVLCVSSDGIDQLVIGSVYTVSHVHNKKEIQVEEIIEFVHFTKRFEAIKEQTK